MENIVIELSPAETVEVIYALEKCRCLNNEVNLSNQPEGVRKTITTQNKHFSAVIERLQCKMH